MKRVVRSPYYRTGFVHLLIMHWFSKNARHRITVVRPLSRTPLPERLVCTHSILIPGEATHQSDSLFSGPCFVLACRAVRYTFLQEGVNLDSTQLARSIDHDIPTEARSPFECQCHRLSWLLDSIQVQIININLKCQEYSTSAEGSSHAVPSSPPTPVE